MNFLEETLGELIINGKTPEDVIWVGDNKICFSWEEFAKVADFDYERVYGNYGSETINPFLVIVGQDWWLKRNCDYDDYEEWIFITKPDFHKRNLNIIRKEDLVKTHTRVINWGIDREEKDIIMNFENDLNKVLEEIKKTEGYNSDKYNVEYAIISI
jgi:hypothetical protein